MGNVLYVHDQDGYCIDMILKSSDFTEDDIKAMGYEPSDGKNFKLLPPETGRFIHNVAEDIFNSIACL